MEIKVGRERERDRDYNGSERVKEIKRTYCGRKRLNERGKGEIKSERKGLIVEALFDYGFNILSFQLGDLIKK